MIDWSTDYLIYSLFDQLVRQVTADRHISPALGELTSQILRLGIRLLFDWIRIYFFNIMFQNSLSKISMKLFLFYHRNILISLTLYIIYLCQLVFLVHKYSTEKFLQLQFSKFLSWAEATSSRSGSIKIRILTQCSSFMT